MPSTPLDVDLLLASVSAFQAGGRSPVDVLRAAGVDSVGDEELLVAVLPALRDRPDLIQSWQDGSYGKRWSPSPYLDGLEVGHYDEGKQCVRRHESHAEACADFVLAEVRWIVDSRIVP